jgi:stalled ribosome rescue protein Dom34
VKMGAFHTIELELNRKFELRKPLWDSVHLERIEQATDPSRSADLAAVIMQVCACVMRHAPPCRRGWRRSALSPAA